MEKNNERFDLFRTIALTAFGAITSVTLVFPLLLELSFVKKIFKIKSLMVFIGIMAIIFAILLLSWERMISFWKRYRATKKIEKFQLISVEIIVLYFIFTAILSIIKSCIIPEKDIIPSWEFIIFIVINSVFFLIWFFISFYPNFYHKVVNKEKKEETPQPIVNKETSFVRDNPITSKSQDKLRREKFVEDLSKIILKLPTDITGSFTIGLNGSWGEGKTSVIKLLIEKLEPDSKFKENFLLIPFNPWYFEDEKAILNAFYDQLENAFSTKFIFPCIKKSIARYLKIISTGVSLPDRIACQNDGDRGWIRVEILLHPGEFQL